jgi:hypothetical protein
MLEFFIADSGVEIVKVNKIVQPPPSYKHNGKSRPA